MPVRYRVWTQANLRRVDEQGRWPGLHTLIRVETSRHPKQGQPEPMAQQRYYISSRVLTPVRADGFVRGRWAIENALRG